MIRVPLANSDFRCGGGAASLSPTEIASIAAMAGADGLLDSIQQGSHRSPVLVWPFGSPIFFGWRLGFDSIEMCQKFHHSSTARRQPSLPTKNWNKLSTILMYMCWGWMPSKTLSCHCVSWEGQMSFNIYIYIHIMYPQFSDFKCAIFVQL